MSGCISYPFTTTKQEDTVRIVINIDDKSVFTDYNGNKSYMLTADQAKQIRKTITKQLRQLK